MWQEALRLDDTSYCHSFLAPILRSGCRILAFWVNLGLYLAIKHRIFHQSNNPIVIHSIPRYSIKWIDRVHQCVCMCVCMFVWVSERERVCVCVCVRLHVVIPLLLGHRGSLDARLTEMGNSKMEMIPDSAPPLNADFLLWTDWLIDWLVDWLNVPHWCSCLSIDLQGYSASRALWNSPRCCRGKCNIKFCGRVATVMVV
jgi:hypothetical protein